MPAPAGLMRGPSDHGPDAVRPPRTYCKGGINGAVVVLEPDCDESEHICAILRGEAENSPNGNRKLLTYYRGRYFGNNGGGGRGSCYRYQPPAGR